MADVSGQKRLKQLEDKATEMIQSAQKKRKMN
jgi:hypothetical protein